MEEQKGVRSHCRLLLDGRYAIGESMVEVVRRGATVVNDAASNTECGGPNEGGARMHSRRPRRCYRCMAGGEGPVEQSRAEQTIQPHLSEDDS